MLGQPALPSRRVRPTARHDGHPILVQALTYYRSDSAHAASYVSNSLHHIFDSLGYG
ncbi:hypothetical protein BN2476_360057 [Paraburkholderia piptadeniae]|uniref:Uncharacterized protein n=1 Tax=Paraburkholderia piptadeniae TaxID=1701573 RepID=A0A1N7SAE6_9BURK|nr:hypothetical protein BN2476_360057 [Paraburkholderia piptadeniae]